MEQVYTKAGLRGHSQELGPRQEPNGAGTLIADLQPPEP